LDFSAFTGKIENKFIQGVIEPTMKKRTRMVLGILLTAVTGVYFGCNDDDGVQRNDAQPTITAMTPSVVSIGQRNVQGQILGTNLSGVTGISMGDGIGLVSFAAAGNTQINVVFNVESNAGSGAKMIVVETSTGTTSSNTVFQVTSNKAPRARFQMDPPAGSLNTVFAFDASNSADDDGQIKSYRWDFGDGSTTNGRKVTHKYQSLGNYSVNLTVTDDDEAVDTAGRDVEILRNSPPIAIFTTSPSKGSTFTNFAFDASRSNDPDGRITDYRWDFGDGKRAKGEDVTHTYAREGNYDVNLTVVDNRGLTGSTEREVEVDKQQGVNCTGRGGKGDAFVFRVIEADRAKRTIIAQFNGDYGCRPYYRCGDIRKGGLKGGSPGKEYWIGVMCEFIDLGGGRAQIKTVLGNYWPSAGEDKLYTWAQVDCSQSVCR
jgi:PKD repeat protein